MHPLKALYMLVAKGRTVKLCSLSCLGLCDQVLTENQNIGAFLFVVFFLASQTRIATAPAAPRNDRMREGVG